MTTQGHEIASYGVPRRYSIGDIAWSPDGRRLGYELDVGRSGSNVMVMGANGRGRRRLARNAAAPDWSPDGRRIAFERRGGIWTMNADGSGQRLLIRRGRSPAWSPDGQSIAFSRGKIHTSPLSINADAYFRSQEIYVARLDGTRVQRLTHDREYEDYPAWSPDGQRIAYALGHGSDAEDTDLFVMNFDGRHEHHVYGHYAAVHRPRWSPDGKQLIFSQSEDDFLVVIKAGGQVSHVSLGKFGLNCYTPSWTRSKMAR